jgi:hypothetical protein
LARWGRELIGKTLYLSWQSPMGCVVARDRRYYALHYILGACSVPSASPRRNKTCRSGAHDWACKLWSLVSRSVGVELAWQVIFCPHTPRYGRAATVRLPPLLPKAIFLISIFKTSIVQKCVLNPLCLINLVISQYHLIILLLETALYRFQGCTKPMSKFSKPKVS